MTDTFERVSIIIPLLNNADQIDLHLSSLAPIISRFGQVIVVDSYSDDGTFERAQDFFKGIDALLYQRPRGLYESWNCAISKVEMPYTYVSTVGDFPNLDHLERFFLSVIESGSDVGLSPPEVYREQSNGKACAGEIRWPIFDVIERFGIKKTQVLEPEVVALLNSYCVYKFGSSSLSGSFASNLIRTDLLKSEPFPSEFSGAGDFVWWGRVCGRSRVLLYPRKVAKFHEHEKTYSMLLNDVIQEMLNVVIDCNSEPQELREVYRELQATKAYLKAKKVAFGNFRYVFPRVYWERRKRKQLREQLNIYCADWERELMQKIACA